MAEIRKDIYSSDLTSQILPQSPVELLRVTRSPGPLGNLWRGDGFAVFSFPCWLPAQPEAGSIAPGVKRTLYTQLWSNTPPPPLFRKKCWDVELKSLAAIFSEYLKWYSSFNKGFCASTKRKQTLFLCLALALSLGAWALWADALPGGPGAHPHVLAVPFQHHRGEMLERHTVSWTFFCVFPSGWQAPCIVYIRASSEPSHK